MEQKICHAQAGTYSGQQQVAILRQRPACPRTCATGVLLRTSSRSTSWSAIPSSTRSWSSTSTRPTLALERNPANLPAFVKRPGRPGRGHALVGDQRAQESRALGPESAQEQILAAARHDPAQEVPHPGPHGSCTTSATEDACREVMADIKQAGIQSTSHYETTIKLVESQSS